MSKIKYILIIFIFLMSIIFTYWISRRELIENVKVLSSNLEDKKNEYQELTIKYLSSKEEIEDIESQLNEALNQILELEKTLETSGDVTNVSKYECISIGTAKVVEKMDYERYPGVTPYVIIEAFQSFSPYIVSVEPDIYNKLEVGKSYEFTFSANWYDLNEYILNEIPLVTQLIMNNMTNVIEVNEAESSNQPTHFSCNKY